MKILHVPFCYYPDPIGGTEVYVEALCRCLKNSGVENVIAAPARESSDYEWNSQRVRRFKISGDLSLNDLYGPGDLVASEDFDRILNEEKPTIVHLHAFTPAVSIRLIRQVKRKKISVVFTYHTPTVSCMRGTLMRWDRQVCDGRLRLRTCSGCMLEGLGVPKPAALFLASMPKALNRFFGERNGMSGGGWTALRMIGLVDLRFEAFKELMRETDHIVAASEWARDVLRINDVPNSKITVSKHGLMLRDDASEERYAFEKIVSSDLKAVFMGRVSEEKGLGLLIEAVLSDPRLNVRLDIYGIVQSPKNEALKKRLSESIKNDERIKFREPVAQERMMAVLKKYDVLAVPSQWLETGPMVVLEAFAAGVPVLASDLGGMKELVQNGKNGVLVGENSAKAWSRALKKISEDRGFLAQLKKNIGPVRQMKEVADEMTQIYTNLLREK